MSEKKDLIDHGTGSGTLCLDFANTVDWHASDKPQETLNGYGDLVEWSRRQRLLTSHEAVSLIARARGQTDTGDTVMANATALREAIYRLFSSKAHERPPDKKDLEVLNSNLARGMSRTRITMEGNDFRWGWAYDDKPLDMMLWPIARATAELLASEKIRKVKECHNEEEGCGWLFLDTSRSQNRAWCNMSSCGNRVKFRRYYDAHQRRKKPRQSIAQS